MRCQKGEAFMTKEEKDAQLEQLKAAQAQRTKISRKEKTLLINFRFLI